jgi:arylformamidase
MALDYSADYNNRAHVPEFPQIVAQWQKDGSAFTRTMVEQGRAELDIRYGSTTRQYIDLYKGNGADAPLAMFIHGGYWKALSPKEHSHFARGLAERGVDVAVAGYDLAPQVSIAQITEQMQAAALFLWKRFGKRITVYGHSAGGHLTACMIGTDWKKLDASAPSDLVAVGSAVSGVFDLTKLVHTDMNVDFKLDDKSAHDGSPLFWPAPKGRVMDVIVGANELPEFVRLSKVMADSWGKAGVETRYEAVPGTHHFNVVAGFTDPHSAMTERLYTLCQRSKALA